MLFLPPVTLSATHSQVVGIRYRIRAWRCRSNKGRVPSVSESEKPFTWCCAALHIRLSERSTGDPFTAVDS